DAQFSIEPAELARLVKTIRNFENAKGKIHYGPADSKEKYNKRFRRSIFVVVDIREGDVFTAENIRVIRPELGLSPSLLEEVIGKRATRDIKKGTPLNSKMVSK
ncbi:MAG: SAF domain-containing protein, partial [Nanoarchaeota archaeon]